MAQAAYTPKQRKSDSEWPTYGRDPGGSRYSPLTQINRDDVKNLKVAWIYRTGAADVKGRSAHNAAFEAVCDVLEARLPAKRVVLHGAGHSLPRAPGYNETLVEFVEAAR